MESSKDHHDPGGGFRNPWDSYQKRSTLSLFGSIRKDPEKADVAALMLLAGRPDFNIIGSSQRKKARSIAATWIGHCTFVVQMDGGNFLTDPIWSMRCGSFPGPKRVVPPPCELDELPSLDAILITSNRVWTTLSLAAVGARGVLGLFLKFNFALVWFFQLKPDHLDKTTVQNLGNRAEWFVPLGVGEFLREHGVTRYTEMDWWESRKLERGATVVCTPSQHFSGRNAKDRDEALWCSWTVSLPWCDSMRLLGS
uniref:Metallo-beta-lactamase domain-containing protein n=1 Tax=Rhodosorus marinus TaxID=101924 RepID=A0A7S3ENY2_9RHOD|mmetsp:Transcript_661/g.1505  ORF Transcript_661/g.1505 Transcript_661/m.1505 type:complete len:254 (+) Transcript_661:919-1680(+)